MTPTEISEHAKEAANWRVYEKMEGRHCTDLDAIQHGINLATAEKDARIAELEERVSWLEQQREFQIQETKDRENEIEEIRAKHSTDLQSKDREIERLKAESEDHSWHRKVNWDTAVSLTQAGVVLTAQLTEANAKLAEAEADRGMWKEAALRSINQTIPDLRDKLSAAQAEIERLKALPKLIIP